MSFEDRLKSLTQKYDALGEKLATGANNLGSEFTGISKEYAHLTPIVELIYKLWDCQKQLSELQEIIDQDNKVIESTIENTSVFAIQEQAIEEIISNDNQIIEAKIDNTVRPLYLEITIEDTILEDNMIIESVCNEVAQPIDFEKINKVQTILKKDKLLF